MTEALVRTERPIGRHYQALAFGQFPLSEQVLSDHVQQGTRPGEPASVARAGRGCRADADRLYRRQPRPRGFARHAQTRRRRLRRALPRLPRIASRGAWSAPFPRPATTTTSCWCATSRSTPPASITMMPVHRQGACRLYAGRQGGGAVQARAPWSTSMPGGYKPRST